MSAEEWRRVPDVDPDVSLRTMRALLGDEGGALDHEARLRLIVDVFTTLDRHLSWGGEAPSEWAPRP